MHELWNLVKGHAVVAGMMNGQNRWGVVSEIRDTDRGYDARVIMQPDGVGSAWVPVLTAFGGSGWGMVARPSVGMQVLVCPDTGDGQHGIIAGMAYSEQARPPKPPNGFQQQTGTTVGDGEWACVSKSGAVIRLCADGTVYIKAPTVNVEANVVIRGNLAVQGDISTSSGPSGVGNVSDVHGSVDRLRGNYDRHVHGNSGPPTPQDPE